MAKKVDFIFVVLAAQTHICDKLIHIKEYENIFVVDML